MSNEKKAVFIVDGVQVYADGKPVVQEPAQTPMPAGGEELEKLRSDRDNLLGQVQGLRSEREDALNLATENGRLLREARENLTKATEDHRITLEGLTLGNQQRIAALAQANQERDTAQGQVATLTSKVAELEGRPLLPTDALERLKKVDGIGDKLGQKALDSLTAPPQSS